VSGNAGAEFSDGGITRLMQRAGPDAEVARNLAHRAEKWTRFSAVNDAPLRTKSIGWIPKVESTFGSDALAARALQRPGRGTERILHPAAMTMPEPADASRPARESRPEVEDLIADIMAGRRNLDDVVLMLVEQDQAFELAAVLGALSRQPARQVVAALFKPDADDIARLCGAIDLSGDGVGALLTLRAKRLALTPPQVARERRRFEAVDHRAQMLVAPRSNLFAATA
jgi:hypothetical protein